MDYDQMNMEQLREELSKRDLKTSGTKDELVARLELNDYSEEEGDSSPEEDEASAPVLGSDDDDDDEGDDEGDPDSEPDPEPAPEEAEEAAPTPGTVPRGPVPRGDVSSVPRVKGRTKQEQQERPSLNYSVLPDGRQVPLR